MKECGLSVILECLTLLVKVDIRRALESKTSHCVRTACALRAWHSLLLHPPPHKSTASNKQHFTNLWY